MLLPGFTAGATLAKSEAVFSGVAGGADLRGATGFVYAASCYDTDYLPKCYSKHPAALGRCCDHTHERVCNGQRVAICTFTECSGFRDTNTSVLTR